MSLPNLDLFRFPEAMAAGMRGKRVFITGSGKHGGLGQAFALAAGLNGAESVGVHFHSSYEDGLETVEAINAAGGNAFPVQADVTNTSDLWALRSYVIRQMGGFPPDLVVCNSGLSERGYVLGRPPKEIDGEPAAARRARVRREFVRNLAESTAVINTKMDGFLYMTHLWAGEALHYNKPLTMVYVSSRQAVDPGAGVPGYVLANFGVVALPRVLRLNLGKKAQDITAFSLALPFVRTGMTEEYAENEKVFGRWQPRMLETHEAAGAFSQLLTRPKGELDDHIFQLNVERSADEGVDITWSQVEMTPTITKLGWSQENPVKAGA